MQKNFDATDFGTRTDTPLQSSGSEAARPADIDTPSPSGGSGAAGAAEEAEGDVEQGARAFMNPITGEAKSAANIASRAGADNSSIIDKGINGAKNVLSNAKEGLGGAPEDLAEGILPEVGEALDFLGPIGAFAGLVTGLVGLFEGLGHKEKQPGQVQVKQGDISVEQTGAGLDTKALMESAPKAGATAY